ncbi:MAG: DNA-binding protein [Candidatus Yanofskybacteria bacterium CG10_big_fil_rev_8_21_14_0_10_36_16]|uniref:DNA-binding protein n=1 Tax=Candidatus Yanofskybacteria bacterium CG10_big_fil_rev_8_21_14_0_10_36_16 TaxID=1975096 RepID=A0A2J0Q8I8_9BACT|nr:MAG: DNA-binding protein [Candidatus Yanofskybacteria bacterium CG10_big_fil_rev_8_21_14_0_10_36_16]
MALFWDNPEYGDFKKLALRRIREAITLFNNKEYSGAYYLAGYAVELALKACYCKNVKEKSFPPKKSVYQKLYSHDLNDLLSVSGIKWAFDKRAGKDKGFESNWSTVKDWTEESRYGICKKTDAEALINSIKDRRKGILVWIKKLW